MPEEEFQFGPWTAGLINAVSAYSIPPDGLSLAEDINIDRDGVAETRKKWNLEDAEHYVSVFEHGELTYSVRGTSPRQVGIVGEGSFTAIATVAGPLAWTTLNGEPVYTDGEVIRVIRGNAAEPLDEGWFKTDEADEYQFVPLPGGSHLYYWQGRLVVGRGNSILWSEALRYGIHSAPRGFITFPTRVVWVAPLPTGIYVGLREHVYFLSGSDPAKFTRRLVGGASAPGVSAVYDPVHTQGAGHEVALWFTSNGIAIGNQSGAVEYPQAGRLKNLPLHHGKMVVENDRVIIFTTQEH